MQAAYKLNVTIEQDHTIRLPDTVPEGPAEIIVLVGSAEAPDRRQALAERRRRAMGSAAGLFKVPDDFDDPLPAEILRQFEDSELEPGE